MAQEYIKGTGTGRGGWRGGGRPKGSTSVNKENKKKMYSFRLSEEELQAVRNVLADMRKKLVILFLMLLFALPVNAFEYTIDTAREEAFKNIPKFCVLPNREAVQRTYYTRNLDTNNILAIQQINNRYIDVIYKDLPNVIYRYQYKQKGLYEPGGYYGNSVRVLYNDNGIKKIASYYCTWFKLHNVVLDVSDNEKYQFDMDGNLLEYMRGSEHKKYGLKWSTIKKHSATYSGQ